MRLANKVCIITGAGMGIGRAAALIFAREGARVVVADLLPKEGNETVNMVKKAGGEAAFVQVDVTKAAEVERMARFATDTYGKIDVLYNNAAINLFREDRMIAELKEEVWDRVFDVNAKGTYLCCKYVIPELLKCGGGSIINTSSNAGVVALEFPAYGASKAAVILFTKVIARQYGNKNIRANALCPAFVDTGMLAAGRKAREEQPTAFPYQETLLRRPGRPDEIAYMALFLASDESSYVTGATILVDGGWTAV